MSNEYRISVVFRKIPIAEPSGAQPSQAGAIRAEPRRARAKPSWHLAHELGVRRGSGRADDAEPEPGRAARRLRLLKRKARRATHARQAS